MASKPDSVMLSSPCRLRLRSFVRPGHPLVSCGTHEAQGSRDHALTCEVAQPSVRDACRASQVQADQAALVPDVAQALVCHLRRGA